MLRTVCEYQNIDVVAFERACEKRLKHHKTVCYNSLRKAIYLCITGALIFIIGCVFSYYHFHFRAKCCITLGAIEVSTEGVV